MDDALITALLERIVGTYAPDVPSARAAIRLVLEQAHNAGARAALMRVMQIIRESET